eukprot:349359-Hanusia_phi.AAC.2
MEEALAMRGEGKLEEAEKALRALVRKKRFEEPAKYELSILLHAQGKHKEADKLAAELGFKYRLNDAVFEGGRGVSKREGAEGKALIYDNAISEEMLKRLEQVFGEKSDFWSKHEYPTDFFFSYNAPIMEAKSSSGKRRRVSSSRHAGNSSDKPGGALLQQLARTFTRLAVPLTGGEEPSSVEWWAHSRERCCGGHQLHFDLDEIRVREGEGYPHPIVSSVLYLHDGGSPTLITDESIDDGEEEGGEEKTSRMKGFLCRPKRGRVLLFDGSLLHGVCPTSFDGPDGTRGKKETPRTTIMLGLWQQGVRTTRTGTRTSFMGPNMSEVSKTCRGRWSEHCSSDPPQEEEGKNEPVEDFIPVGPLWQEVERGERGGKGSGGDFEDLGKFLLKAHPKEVRRLCTGKPPDTSGAVTIITREELEKLMKK